MAEDLNLVALRWQEAIATDAVDWSRLTDWLEADTANRDAFNAVTQLSAMLRTHGPSDIDSADHDADRFAADIN